MKAVSEIFNEQSKESINERDARPSPFCLRLSREERALLERAAGGLSLSEYVRRCLFKEAVTRRRRSRRKPLKDKKLLGQVLAALGNSRLSSNLNQIAKAIHTGTLVLSPEVRAVLLEACADIQAIRSMLIKALGLDS